MSPLTPTTRPMNDDSNTPPPQDPSSSEDTSHSTESSEHPFEDFSKSIHDAFRTGSEDARKAFDKAIPQARKDLAQGVHDITYAFAYASSFGAALVKEITPDTVSDGFREGSAAGKQAADEVIRKRRERSESQAHSEEPDLGTAPA